GAVGAVEHVADRVLVVLPPFAVAPVVGADLVALEPVGLAVLEALELSLPVDVEEELRHPDAIGRQRPFEGVDLVVSALPLRLPLPPPPRPPPPPPPPPAGRGGGRRPRPPGGGGAGPRAAGGGGAPGPPRGGAGGPPLCSRGARPGRGGV